MVYTPYVSQVGIWNAGKATSSSVKVNQPKAAVGNPNLSLPGFGKSTSIPTYASAGNFNVGGVSGVAKSAYTPVPVRASIVAGVPLVLAAAKVANTIETSDVLKIASPGALKQGSDVVKIAAQPKPASEVIESHIQTSPSGLEYISKQGMTQAVSDVPKVTRAAELYDWNEKDFTTVLMDSIATQKQFLQGVLSSDDQTRLNILGALTHGTGVAGLREERNVGQMIEESLKEHPEFDLTAQQREDLVKYYPDIGISLLSGATKDSDVKAFFESKDALLASVSERSETFHDAYGNLVKVVDSPGGSVGLTVLDDQLAVAEFCARGKIAGADIGSVQGVVAEYLRRLDPESNAKMTSWISSGDLINGTNLYLTRLKPGESAQGWMRDDNNQLMITAGAILVGGAGGLALKGVAGLAGGALMGVFAGTEIPGLSNSNTFAETQIRKLAEAGIKDAATSIGGFKSEFAGTTQAYNDALKRGDLADADRQAAKLQDISDRYANFMDDNWAAYQKAGILDQARSDLVDNYDLATQNRFTEGTPPKDSAKYPLDGYDPKQDWIKVNGVTLTSFTGDALTLPAGEYKIERGRTGYDSTTAYATVTRSGGLTTGDSTILSESKKQALAAIGTKVDAAKDPFTGEQRTTTAEKSQEFDKGVDYEVVWQKGWQVQDPYTLEWKDSGTITVKGDGTTNVLFKDPDGNVRYTRVTTNDPFQSKFITGLDTLPYQPTQVQPYKAPTKTGEGNIWFGDDMMPGAKYYLDGKEITENMAGIPVTPGDHSLIVMQDGFKPLEKTINVIDGESNFVSLAHVLVPEPVAYSSGGGGGGGGGGGDYSPPAAPQTMIMFGTSLKDCKLWLDGVEITPTLGTAYDTTPGYHAFKAQKNGMLDYDKNVYTTAGESLTVNAVFVAAPAVTPTDPTNPVTPPVVSTKTAKLTFGNGAVGAAVYVDDGYVDITPGVVYELAPGYHGVKLVKSGMVDWLKTVYLAAGDTLTVSPVFDSIPEPVIPWDNTPIITSKRVFINSNPTGAKILINDGATGEWTPAYVDLERGLYKLTTQKSGLADGQSWIYVGDTIAFGNTALALAEVNGYGVPQ